MIKKIVPLVLVFAAVCAVAALAAASASALPAFLATEGKTFPLSFTSTGVGNSELNTEKHKVVCKTVKNVGTILPVSATNTKESMLGDVQFDFNECEETVRKVACWNTSTASKLILTPTYIWHLGKLVTLEDGVKEVLILVLVTTTEFTCGISGILTEKVTTSGNLIGVLDSNFNNATTEADIAFSQIKAGSQTYKTFEALLPEETINNLDLKSTVEKEPEELASEVATGIITTDGNVILSVN
jgi:hypothetical protein